MTDYNVSITISAADQASDELRNVENRLRNLDDSTDGIAANSSASADGLDRMASKANFALDAAIIDRGFQLAAALYQIGENSRTAGNVFDSLAMSAGLSDDVMAQLQDRTHNIVDETTLMNGANRLLMMGLVDNQDELVDMIGLITDLSIVTGKDLTSSFQDFGALLANQSVLRLDNFGLSSERVRTRIEELQSAAEDLSDEDAFRMAVLEEGARVLETVAPAIEENITALDRAEASAANIGSQMGENFAGNINQALTSFEQLVQLPGLMAQQAQMMDASEAERVFQAFSEIDPSAAEELNRGMSDGIGTAFIDQLKSVTDTYTEFFGSAPQTMDTLQATMNDFDFTPAEEAAAQFWLDYINGGEEAMAAVEAAAQESTDNVTNELETISTQLETMSGQTYTMRIRVDVDDPSGVLTGAGFGGAPTMSSVVRANGGVVPGQDNRVAVNGR